MVLGVCHLMGADSIGDDSVKNFPWTFVSKQIEPIPLEYQAVAFRRTVRNETDKTFTSVYPEYGAGIVFMKRPSEMELRSVEGDILSFNRPHTDPDRYYFIHKSPLVLKPGYESSIAYASAANWRGTLVEPLLPEPGKYTFVFEHGDRLDFVVRAAKGRDKAIRDQLRTNPPLAEAMLSPDHPPVASVVPAIKRVIELYPESSYADYARFALARWYASRLHFYGTRRLSLEEKTDMCAVLNNINPKFAYAPRAMVLRYDVLKQSEPLEADFVLGQLRKNWGQHPRAIKTPDARTTQHPRTRSKNSEAKK